MNIHESDLQPLLEKYESLSADEKELLHSFLKSGDNFEKNYKTLKSYIWIKEPPTPEEFLDPVNGFLPLKIAEGLYDYIKKDFIKAMNTKKPFHNLVTYGSTRCETKDTEILMYDLSVKKIQDVVVGDLLMGDDSTPRKVLSLARGYGKLYKVEQNKGEDYIVNENHILTLQWTNWSSHNKQHKDANNTIDLEVAEYLKLSKTKKHKLKGLKAKLNFPEQQVFIDPYFLGMWLGDGASRTSSVTSMDKEIIEYIYKYAADLELSVREEDLSKKISNQAKTYHIKNAKGKGNILKKNLQKYNLIFNKHIPNEYIRNSENIRLQVLAGIIDTDGYKDTNGNGYDIILKSKQLMQDVVFLARSLGFRASFKKVTKTIKSIGFSGEYYETFISGALYTIPVHISRKKFLKNELKERCNPLRTGIKISYFGEGEYFGFELDGNRRYLHSDLTITHNTGKTVLSRLFTLYAVIFINYLRFPHLYFQINPMSDICGYLVSFNDAKTNQLLLTPLITILDAAPKFKRMVFESKVRLAEIGEDGVIPFSEASKFGSVTFPKMTLVTGSNPGDYIGGDIVFGNISELNYFKEHSSLTDDEVFQVYTKLSDRIQGTIGTDKFPCFVYLDSSANDAESPIESFINTKLKNNPEAFYRDYVRWEVRPHVFKKWYTANKLIKADPNDWSTKTRYKSTFQVCIGNGDTPSFLVNDPKQLEGVPEDLVIRVPIDSKEAFETSLIESIKDIAGKPSSNESKLITDVRIIQDLFDPLVSNICGEIQVGASSIPEKYIWGKIWKQFFIDEGNGRYRIKRARNEVRSIGVDTAYSAKGDIAGFTMLHNELWHGKKIQVIDFTLPIVPDATGINLEAINQFILDLAIVGGVKISSVVFDSFQSSQMIQNLRRMNIEVIESSVDKTTAPYNNLVMLLHNRLVKVGNNIFLKNNLKSLYRFINAKGKEKIDHSLGKTENKYVGNWESSRCGINAKDVSDSLCSASFQLFFTPTMLPVTDFDMENERLNLIMQSNGHTVINEKKMYNMLMGIKPRKQ